MNSYFIGIHMGPQVQEASLPLGGSFRLSYNGVFTRSIVAFDWQDVKPALELLPGMNAVEVWLATDNKYE